MQIWVAFLVLSFWAGVRSLKRDGKDRFAVMMVVCLLVAIAISSYRWA
jgi:hypothetical protein